MAARWGVGSKARQNGLGTCQGAVVALAIMALIWLVVIAALVVL